MTDEQIVEAVRSGTHTLVPMPGSGRKFFVGYVKDADVSADTFGLILDVNPDDFEGEEMVGLMMGGLCRHASDCATHNAPALPNGPCDCRDDEIAF